MPVSFLPGIRKVLISSICVCFFLMYFRIGNTKDFAERTDQGHLRSELEDPIIRLFGKVCKYNLFISTRVHIYLGISLGKLVKSY